MTQALGVVYVLVSSEATKYRLPEQPGQRVSAILASACVGKNITRHCRQPEHVVEFAIRQQSVRRYLEPVLEPMALRAADDVTGFVYSLRRCRVYWQHIAESAAELVSVDLERLSALRQEGAQ